MPHGLNVTGPQYRTNIVEQQFTVGNGASSTLFSAPAAGIVNMLEARNVSNAGQQIRIGINPQFGGSPSGILLNPGEGLELLNIATAMFAIASAAGALLDVDVWKTS